MAVVAMLAVITVATPTAFAGGRLAVSVVAEVTGVVPAWAQRPALAQDAATAPLGTAAPAPAGAGGFHYLGVQDDGSGQPVRWDPCRPIHYVVRADGAPPGGDEAIRFAVARIQQLTGLRFVRDGATTERPREERPTMDPGRYGKRWSPVLVAWTDPQEYPEMAGYAGLGGPDGVSGRGRASRRYVTGVVLLNRDHLTDIVGWPQGRQRLQAVVLHEFGHLVGLDHVDDPNQLMFRRPTALDGIVGDGDRRGLAQLGKGPCFRDF